jgi:hypothetical protein
VFKISSGRQGCILATQETGRVASVNTEADRRILADFPVLTS